MKRIIFNFTSASQFSNVIFNQFTTDKIFSFRLQFYKGDGENLKQESLANANVKRATAVHV